MQNNYIKLMKKCIKLAKMADGRVSPNPLVGAVIFDDDFNIISEGYHKKYGENHAERNAILNAECNLKGKSIIVNLEPCSHYGKTPPCTDLIIENGIKRVIIGMIDPNPMVSGKGIKKLKEAGIEVITGILEKECKNLNEIFIKNQLIGMPFITIKTAVTTDGKIASKTGNSKWITDEISRKYVQILRNKYDAILTGSNTVIKDNPSMTCRMKNGRNPLRIVLDTNLKTPADSKIYNDDGTKVIIICSDDIPDKRIKKYPDNVKIIKCEKRDNYVNLKSAVNLLYKENIRSILVESGARVNNSFIQENLADKIIQFIAPKILADKDGISFAEGCSREYISECNNLNIVSVKKLKNDIMLEGYFEENKIDKL